MILIVVFILLAGVLLFLVFGRDKIDIEKLAGAPASQKNEATIDNIKIGVPDLDVAVSPMEELHSDGLSFDLDVPSDVLGNIEANTDVSPSDFDYQLKHPEPRLDPPEPRVSAGAPDTGSTGQTSGVDCSMFNAIPDCSYVGSNYTAICRQCKGN